MEESFKINTPGCQQLRPYLNAQEALSADDVHSEVAEAHNAERDEEAEDDAEVKHPYGTAGDDVAL